MADAESSIFALARLQLELDRLFQEARGAFAGTPRVAGGWQPPVDVLAQRDRVVVVMELPEMTAAELVIEIQHHTVTIRGTRSVCAPEDPNTPSSRFLRLERPHGSFERRIDLGRPVDSRRGRARLTGGLLTIEFPLVRERRAHPQAVTLEEDP